ncbi:multicopper oxidase family protein [Aneurinibacillus sp. Ricciae_BoGa-3]|uniref:multicopper oxidase family protein n=1 Tax=Aneurinibacillus sp. Ricciae_BoGa-3 TaxID=3022697 RepID=UPI0023417626|nr:multicopper oxidase family protein [Aneurinibacillus sp. Ricciae_BoGa-3]WCK56512.1 multicopper oxidase family protein [Aneurinibacillus sp. Ricciae_BoGa-3]
MDVIRKKRMILCTIAAIFILFSAIYIAIVQRSKLPATMNMGDMAVMGSMDMKNSSKIKEISVTSLKEVSTPVPTRTFTLTAEEKDINLSGKNFHALTYNGQIPGPLLRVQQGDRVVVHVKNKLAEGVTIHWHGVAVPNAEDGVAGVTQNAIPPNGDFTYNFIAKNAGTYWYHSHQQSYKETTAGLYGILVVEPKNSPIKYDRDFTIALHDWDLKTYTVNSTSEGEHFAANPGQLVRLRIVNTGNITHNMSLAGAPFKVIALDGHDIQHPTDLNQAVLPIGASQRYDISFRMPASGSVKMINMDTQPSNIDIITKTYYTPSAEKENQMLTATFGSGDLAAHNAPANASVFDPAAYGKASGKSDSITFQSKFAQTYTLKLGDSVGFFDGGFAMIFKINDKSFPDVPSIRVKEGQLIKLHFENDTGMDHPMHIHGHTMKLLAKNGKPVSGSPVYLDTILVKPHETYDAAFRADNPGLWMIHCHNLAHSDYGMDMMVSYEGVTTPYRVGSQSGNHPD